MKQWRTTRVVSLCQAIREAQDYSACPILADALEDLGCEDIGILSPLRSTDELAAQRMVAILYSEDTEEAVRVVEAFAEEIGPRALYEEGDGHGQPSPTDYYRLMRVGNRFSVPDEYGYGDHTTENGSEDLRSFGDGWFDRFWEAYALITGRRAKGNPFSCTC